MLDVQPEGENHMNEIQEVIMMLLDQSDRDKLTFFAGLQDHTLFHDAQDFALNGQPDAFFHALPSHLDRLLEGFLLTILPENREAHFILSRYSFLNSHFKKIIERREGSSCSADKSRTILSRLLQYYLNGQEVVFDPGEEYTFGHPTVVFTTHREIVEFFEALRNLYYGIPGKYLAILTHNI